MQTKTADKKPRGSKLDAKKGAEYKSEVAKANVWDTSLWTAWTVVGRVLPERCNVTIAPINSQGTGAGGRFKLRLEVAQSHVAAQCFVEKSIASIFEIADIVRTALAFPVDYIAFQHRGVYEIVLDIAVNHQNGGAQTIPIFEPMFETKDAGVCFDAHSDKMNLVIPYKAAEKPELPTALHDLTAAVRYPRRTFEHCRMAVEVIRGYFDPSNVRDHKRRQI